LKKALHSSRRRNNKLNTPSMPPNNKNKCV
jgi:hypothetical protein